MENAERTQQFIQAVHRELDSMAEMNPELNRATGATAHMLATQHDTGKQFILTGHDSAGRYFKKSAKSFTAAYAMLTAAYGLTRVWQVYSPANTRRLVYSRA